MKRFCIVMAVVVLATAAAAQPIEPGYQESAYMPEIIVAARQGDVESIEWLLERGAFIDAQDWYGGGTALMAAAERGLEPTVFMLLRRGAHVNAIDAAGRTAMLYAAKRGEAQVVQTLIDFGGDVNAYDEQGRTPLMFAAGTN